ncbi:putative outer membrane starch-binding protein [Chitinophaga niastensis]|uniref:Putative outer membrane starch-binding protein n=1 Tax=Chitinophaga niastensis TaxID=536980 RepID=A0A2P8HA13_CHINA|nr:RagB/SusD family nutrient uptake outer membrane protein [Chitinophaga niastensis]PSL43067.1 putative outer membrane starch-binding protein [Chitinophaga niastensis]
MKKYFCYIIIVAAALSSCKKDFLQRAPLDALSDATFWNSDKDAIAAVNGCYKGWETGYNIIYLDCAADNSYNPFPWEGYTDLGSGYATPTNGNIAVRWDFTTVRKCNEVLENIGKPKMDEDLRKRLKAETRFIRAYQYFIMNRLYGDVPLVTKTLTIQEANTQSRTAGADVVKFILDELTAIAPDLPVSYSGSDKGRITQGAALALKARIELYQGMYDAAIADCQLVMKLGYDLFRSTNSYQDLFRIQNNNNIEVILDVQYKKDDNPFDIVGIMLPASLGGWCSLNPNQNLVDAYEMTNGKTIDDPTSGYNPNDPYKNRDPRLSASILVPGAKYEGSYYNPIQTGAPDFYSPYGNSKTGYLVKKFAPFVSDYADIWNTGLNIMVIRYAEVLLTYAEAKIEKGSIDGSVYNAIDAVRTRAGMPATNQAVYNNQTKLRELIRRERRVELGLEGLRWFDVQRWKIGPQVMPGPLMGARLGTVNPNNGALALTPERIKVEDRVFDINKNYLWPVPQKEIDLDKNLKQNPNY